MTWTVLNPAFTDAIGWTLIHFLWEGAAIALLFYLFSGFTRSANVRYASGMITLGLMTLVPMITFAVLANRHDQSAAVMAMHTSGMQVMLSSFETVAGSSTGLPIAAARSFFSVDWLTYCVLLWLGGVTVCALRALGGYLALERVIRQRSEPVAAGMKALCLGLQERIGLVRNVRYAQSELVEAPSVLGWFRPAVLIPVSALTGLSPQQLEAVIVHELAHIKRLDCFVNLFQIALETVFFYHPAIWWVNRQIRQERENCCDDIAIAVCGDSLNYAKALALMEGWRKTPAIMLAATSGELKARVGRILGLDLMARSMPQAGLAVAGSLLIGSVILTTLTISKAIAQPSEPVVAQTSSEEQMVASEPVAAVWNTPIPAVPARPKPASHPKTLSAAVKPEVAVEETSDSEDSDADDADDSAPKSYIGDLRSAGLDNMSVEDLIELKIQGVSPQYVRDMRAAGFDASVGDLIALKIQGVTAAYVRGLREAGVKDLSAGQVVAMKVQGLDPAQVGEFRRELKGDDLSIGKIIAFKVQGITPEYIEGLRSAGLKNLSSGQLIAAKVQGLTPEFIKKVRDHGLSDISIDQLIRLKVMGVF